MATKKLVLFAGLLCLVGSSAFSQQPTEGTYNVQDSSVIPSKRLPQHTEFMANNYAFPAKPRNQWEVGLKVGAFAVSGDIRASYPGFGIGLHARKALGYVVSLRGEFGWGQAKGVNYTPSLSYINNPAWASYKNALGVPATGVFYNYKTQVLDFSLQTVLNIGNIRFHKDHTKLNLYGFAGLGGMIYNPKIDSHNGDQNYDFSTLNQNGLYSDRRELKKSVKNLLDGEYESAPEQDGLRGKLFGTQFRPLFTFGVGLQYKLNKKFSLALEDRIGIPLFTDLLDGHQWQSNSVLNPALTRGNDTYNFLSLGINMAFGGKAVEPLWWINPLDYAYNEINKPNHMKLPKPVLDDADGDGVTDQFDNEPNTPAGAPVDAHGVSRDTDGDGVPDSKDKELITPTQCQPVDADGVGKCPPPDCCKVIDSLMQYGIRGRCNIGDLPSITFKGKTVSLSKDAKALLTGIASKIRDNSECKIAVIGYCSSTKSEQQLSWDRVNTVINYLVEKEGISDDRLIFKYGEEGGDCNTVDLRDGTQEDGPTTVPAPHPNLRRRR